MDEYTVDYIWVGFNYEFKQDPTLKCIVGVENVVYLFDKCGLNRLQEDTSLSDLDKYFKPSPITNGGLCKNWRFLATYNMFSNIKRGIAICPTQTIDCITLIIGGADFRKNSKEKTLLYCLLFSIGQPKLHRNIGINYQTGSNLFGNKLNISEFETDMMIRDIIE